MRLPPAASLRAGGTRREHRPGPAVPHPRTTGFVVLPAHAETCTEGTCKRLLPLRFWVWVVWTGRVIASCLVAQPVPLLPPPRRRASVSAAAQCLRAARRRGAEPRGGPRAAASAQARQSGSGVRASPPPPKHFPKQAPIAPSPSPPPFALEHRALPPAQTAADTEWAVATLKIRSRGFVG